MMIFISLEKFVFCAVLDLRFSFYTIFSTFLVFLARENSKHSTILNEAYSHTFFEFPSWKESHQENLKSLSQNVNVWTMK